MRLKRNVGIKSYTEFQNEIKPLYSTGRHSAEMEAVQAKRAAEEDVVPDTPSFFKSVGASFQRNNFLTSMANDEAIGFLFDKHDPSYNPLRDLGEWENTPYEDMLYGAKNAEHMTALKKKAARFKEVDETIQNTPTATWLFSTLASGVLSPEILIPGSYVVKGLKGASVLKTASTGAALNAGAVAISETGLRISQDDRTAGQSAFTIGAGAVLGGLIGGGAAYLTKPQFDDLATRVVKDLSAPDDDIPVFTPRDAGDAGAARAQNLDTLTKDDITINGKLAAGYNYVMAKLPYFRTPFNAMLEATSPVARQTLVGLVDMTVPMKGMLNKAFPTSVEGEINATKGGLGRYIVEHQNSFNAYKKRAAKEGKETMTYRAFNERVSYALRNGDVDPDGIKEVTRAAQKARSEVLDPRRKTAIELGVFDENVDAKFADSYLMRVWDRNKLIANRDEALEMFREWAGKKVSGYVRETESSILALRSAKATKKTAEKISKLEDELRLIRNATSDGYSEHIDEIANAVYQKLIGVQDFDTSFMKAPVTKGPLKEKLIDIDDNIAARFLDNDAPSVLARYNEKMSAELALTRMFGRADMADQIKKINDDYDKLAASAKTAKERKKLNIEREKMVAYTSRMRDLLRGSYKMFSDPDSTAAQAHTVVKDLVYMSTLGGVTTSSLGDVSRVVMVHGIQRAFGDMTGALLKNTSKTLKKFQADEVAALGFDMEHALSSHVMAYSDITDPLMRGSIVTRTTGAASDAFSKMTLINRWNDFVKTFGMLVTQTRVLKALENGTDEKYLNFLGLDKQTRNIIKQQVAKHGEVVGGRKYSGAHKWDVSAPNVEKALNVYRAAMRKEANSMIVTKSVADIPMWANTAAGQIIFQLKSYVWAANQRVTMRALAEPDANTLTGLVMMVGMGAAISEIKYQGYKFSKGIKGQEVEERDRNTQTVLLDAIDRSGVVPLIMETNAMFAPGGLSIQSLIGAQTPSRYAQTSGATRVLGPAIGQILEGSYATSRVLEAAATGDDVYKSDINRLRRSIPFQNAIGVNYLFDAVEGGANKLLDAK